MLAWKNKKTVSLISFFTLILLSMGCSNFYEVFERVEPNYLKTIDFVYRNASDTALTEAMPGDTVLLYAYFAGTKITSFNWDVSFDVYIDNYGKDTAYNRQPLSYDVVALDTSTITSNTHCEAIKFVIPNDIMYHSPSVDDATLEQLGMSREQVLSMVNMLMSVDTSEWDSNPIITEILDRVGDQLYLVMQVFTVPVRIYAEVNGKFKIKSDMMVRYNRYFKSVENINVNRNTKVNFIGIHKFKTDPGPNANISSMGSDDTTFVLFINDTSDVKYFGTNPIFKNEIAIDSGFFYYISVDSGVIGLSDQRDTGTAAIFDTTIGAMTPKTSPELFYSQWFFQLDSLEMAKVSDSQKWPLITNSTYSFDRFYMATDINITEAVIWAQTYDYFFGERLREKGSSIRETKVYFEYTDAYIRSLNN